MYIFGMKFLQHISFCGPIKSTTLLRFAVCILVAIGMYAGGRDLHAQVSRSPKGKKPIHAAPAQAGRYLLIDCGRGGRAQIFKASPSRSEIQQPDYVAVAESISTRVEFVRGIPLHVAVVPAKGLKLDSV